MIYLGLILFIFSILGTVSGDTIIVDDDPGPWADHDLIQDALDDASDGDVILVYEGTYNESIYVNSSVTIKGNGSELTQLYGFDDDSVINLQHDNVLIEDLGINNGITGINIGTNDQTTIRNCAITASSYSGIFIAGSQNVINNCAISNCSEYGIRLYNGTGTSIEYCQISDNNGTGIFLSRSIGNRIHNNSIRNNLRDGIHIPSWSDENEIFDSDISFNGYSGIFIDNGDDINVERCNITGNSYMGLRLSSSQGTHIGNSTLSDNGIDVGLNGGAFEGCEISNGFSVSVDRWSDLRGYSIENCTARGKPIYYLDDEEDITLTGAGQVLISNSYNVTITESNMANVTNGFVVVYSHKINFTDSSIHCIEGVGITAIYSGLNVLNVSISQDPGFNSVFGNDTTCVAGGDMDSLLIRNCEFSNSYRGIDFEDSENIEINGTVLQNHSDKSINLYYCNGVEIQSTNVFEGGSIPVYLSRCEDIIIGNCNFSVTGFISCYLQSPTNVTVEDSEFAGGLDIDDLDELSLSNCTVRGLPLVFLDDDQDLSFDSDVGQLLIYQSSRIDIEDVHFSYMAPGIIMTRSDNVTISNSSFHHMVDSGLIIGGSDNVTVVNCSFLDCDGGIIVGSSRSVNISLSEFRANRWEALRLYSSHYALTGGYSITGCEFYDQMTGITGSLYDTSLIVRNCTFVNHTYAAMQMRSSTKIVIVDSSITGSHYGIIFTDYCSDGVVSNVTIEKTEMCGILLNECLYMTITRSSIEDGIHIAGRYHNRYDTHAITNCTSHGDPIYYLSNRENVTIEEHAGQIIIVNSSRIDVVNVDIYRMLTPVMIIGSNEVNIWNSTFAHKGREVLYALESNNISISNCTFDGSQSRESSSIGLSLVECQDVTIIDCFLSDHSGIETFHWDNPHYIRHYGGIGINALDCAGIDILNSTISNCSGVREGFGYGIKLENCPRSTIVGCTVMDINTTVAAYYDDSTAIGIYLQNSNNSQILGSSVSNINGVGDSSSDDHLGIGLYCDSCDHIDIHGSNFDNIVGSGSYTGIGILIESCNDTSVDYCSMSNTSGARNYASGGLLASGTTNLSITNCTATASDHLGYGPGYGFYLSSITHGIIRSCVVSSCGENRSSSPGISFHYTDDMKIKNVTVYNHTNGLSLSLLSGHQYTIEDCDIGHNDGDGIQVRWYYSSSGASGEFNNVIANCTIHDNSENGIKIVESGQFDKQQHRIELCEITNNSMDGIHLENSDSNQIFANEIMDNGLFGISVDGSSNDNKVFYNTFDGNAILPQAHDGNDDNQWDDGGQGNYWTDYNGTDDDEDGIGDTPYKINGTGDTEDRYPLMGPWNGTYLNITERDPLTFIVDDDWVGANFSSIQEAIDASIDGDTILIFAGEYNEDIEIDRSLTMFGNGTGNTFVVGTGGNDIIHVISENVSISGLYISFDDPSPNYSGISVDLVEDLYVSDCRIERIQYGIFIYNSENILLENLTLNNNTGTGIHLRSCSEALIRKCSIGFNDHVGLGIYSSDSIEVIRCHFTKNSYYAIRLDNCDNIEIHHNDFIDNGNMSSQVCDDYHGTSSGENLWDDGSEGNHWSDYSGSDSNGDGIGDSAYDVDGDRSAEDRYPLMSPAGNSEPEARILGISPDPAEPGTNVTFSGSGLDDDGYIVRYVWTSSIDGEFYNGTSNETVFNNLSLGDHTIALQVMDDEGAWSSAETSTLSITTPVPENVRPTADIDSILPDPAESGENVTFRGNGSDEDGDVVRYVWYSSIDGEFYNGSSNTSIFNILSIGNHSIIFRVMDDDGEWSDDVLSNLTIINVSIPGNEIPSAAIVMMSPNPSRIDDNITFMANGSDVDGYIVSYVWTSSIDGQFFYGSSNTTTFKGLTVGTHTITLRVMDDDGAWSDPMTTEVVVDPRTEPVNMCPVSMIDTIAPNPVNHSESINFLSSSYDIDGNLIRYVWISSIDGEFYNGTSNSTLNNSLSVGDHMIYHSVQDNNFTWSNWSQADLQIHPINLAPFISMTDPKNGSIIRGQIILYGNCSDDGGKVIFVELAIDDGTWTRGNGTVIWYFELHSTSISDGVHTISVRCYDGVQYSEIVTIDVVVQNDHEKTDKGSSDNLGLIVAIACAIGIVSIIGAIFILSKHR